MADIELVIKIPEENYKKDNLIHFFGCYSEKLDEVIKNGTPLPKGHGAIKDVSQIEIPMCEDRAYERWVQVAIDSAPTIIKASKEQEDD